MKRRIRIKSKSSFFVNYIFMNYINMNYIKLNIYKNILCV